MKILITVLLLCSSLAFAEEVPAQGAIDSVLSFLRPVLEAAAGQYGWLVAVMTIVGVLRMVFKPAMSLLKTVVDLTPTAKDNELLEKILKNPMYKIFAYLLDWTASVKLPTLKV